MDLEPCKKHVLLLVQHWINRGINTKVFPPSSPDCKSVVSSFVDSRAGIGGGGFSDNVVTIFCAAT